MTGYKLYQDPKIRKVLRQARKRAEQRKIQDWRAKHVLNPGHHLDRNLAKEKQYAK